MDDADRASDEMDKSLAESIRKNARDLPAGVPGECDLCGEWSGRLIADACAPCRDRYKLGLSGITC